VPILRKIIGLQSGIMPICMVPFSGLANFLLETANLNIYVNDS